MDKKPMRNEDGSYNTNSLYKSSKDPYTHEYLKYENPRTGATQIFFLKLDKTTRKTQGIREL
tara:strand:- start:11 stop:196 length:186 start_codon:yes stop_codon:yes gene_type:complete